MIYANWWIFHEARLFDTATSPYLAARWCFTGQISVRRKRQGGTFSEFYWKHQWWSHRQESEERWAVLARQLPKVEDLLKVLQATFASHLIWLQIGKCYGVLLAVAVFCLSRSHLELNHANVPMNSFSRWGKLNDVNVSKSETSHGPRWKNCFWRHLMPQKRWVTRINSRLYREFRRHLQNVEHSFTTSHYDYVWYNIRIYLLDDCDV